MNKERFNHIEDKIRKAAMNAEPPFDERAWEKMEAKLNNEQDRKRPFFWWFFVSIAVVSISSAVIYFSIEAGVPGQSHPDAGIRNGVAADTKDYVTDERNKGIVGNKNAPNFHADEKQAGVTVGSTGGTEVAEHNRPRKKYRSNSITDKKMVAATESGSTYGDGSGHFSRKKKKSFRAKTSIKVNSPSAADKDTEKEVVVVSDISINSNNPDPAKEFFVEENPDKKENGVDSLFEKADVITNGVPDSIVPARSKKNRSRGFYLVASAGPELTGVSGKSASTKNMSARYGVGLGYQVNRKWSVQTGFYSVAKKYVAGKEDYNPKDATYLSSMHDLSVDANCRVFEIPFSLKYSFAKSGTYSFFLSAGVAGVIMKKEDYEFSYTRGTFPYVASYTEEKAFTGNRHFLAFTQFSGGIAKAINKSFSVIAEPYVTLPLQGVGEGRVKLFSAGFQLGIKFKPSKK